MFDRHGRTFRCKGSLRIQEKKTDNEVLRTFEKLYATSGCDQNECIGVYVIRVKYLQIRNKTKKKLTNSRTMNLRYTRERRCTDPTACSEKDSYGRTNKHRTLSRDRNGYSFFFSKWQVLGDRRLGQVTRRRQSWTTTVTVWPELAEHDRSAAIVSPCLAMLFKL